MTKLENSILQIERMIDKYQDNTEVQMRLELLKFLLEHPIYE